MKLQKFNGGINIREASHLIGIDEGVEFENIDISTGTLKSCKQATSASLSVTDKARYIRYLDAITTLAKTPTTLVEYQDKIYYSVDGDYVQIKDTANNIETDLGLEAPIIYKTKTIAPVITPFIQNDITITETGNAYT